MTEEERWDQLLALDEELLLGGALISEWCSFITREAKNAYAKGAFLASILTAVSGVETYLRSEYGYSDKTHLVDLINSAALPEDLKQDLQTLRKYRNKWVHVESPQDDQLLLERIGDVEREVEQMALFAARCLLRTIYSDQMV